MTYQTLHITRDGAVVHLTLNRPTVRNAFNEVLVAELTAWATEAASASDVRCVVLAGAGTVFCAGADLAWMARVSAFSHQDNLKDAQAAAEMFAALDRLPMALIGRVHGAAFGGGAGLASICDIVVAESDTVFGFTETKLGLIAAVISPYVTLKIGQSAARHLFVTGARFSATHAREIGLVHAVVPDAEVDERVAQYVKEILTAGPGAIADVKALLRQIANQPPAAMSAFTAAALATRRETPECQEGLSAFLEKRKPSWHQSR
ncbi:MAG: enoyl-CoA hydratase-related protein [Vicinamibacterales bacterium]